MLLGIILEYLKYLQMVVFTLFTLFIINNKDDYIHKSKYCHPEHELGVTSLTINGCVSTQIHGGIHFTQVNIVFTVCCHHFSATICHWNNSQEVN